MSKQLDREIEDLERRLEDGDISQREYSEEYDELMRYYGDAANEAAEEAAERARYDALDLWGVW